MKIRLFSSCANSPHGHAKSFIYDIVINFSLLMIVTIGSNNRSENQFLFCYSYVFKLSASGHVLHTPERRSERSAGFFRIKLLGVYLLQNTPSPPLPPGWGIYPSQCDHVHWYTFLQQNERHSDPGQGSNNRLFDLKNNRLTLGPPPFSY